MNKITLLTLLASLLLPSLTYAYPATRITGYQKNNYVSDGVMTGGSGTVRSSLVYGIRRASYSGAYERTVIDIKSPVNKTPFFITDVNSAEKRITVTINCSGYDLGYNPARMRRLFSRSSHIANVVSYPQIEDESITIEFKMKKPLAVNVFFLENPARIIFDTK